VSVQYNLYQSNDVVIPAHRSTLYVHVCILSFSLYSVGAGWSVQSHRPAYEHPCFCNKRRRNQAVSASVLSDVKEDRTGLRKGMLYCLLFQSCSS